MAACCNSDLVDMQYCAVRVLTASVAVITTFVVQSTYDSPDYYVSDRLQLQCYSSTSAVQLQ
jgi:hypothetical protein